MTDRTEWEHERSQLLGRRISELGLSIAGTRVERLVRRLHDELSRRVNPNCYLERSAEFSRAAAASGISHDALIARILELAVARYAR
ncbi:MAG TPA: hypothetical protein VF929_09735 [Gemmatimonadaceae bacterium]